MRIGNVNYLLAEKRGCNFFENDSSVSASDVGNYRVFIRYSDLNGTEVVGDVTRFRGADLLAAQMSYYDECGHSHGFPPNDPLQHDSSGVYPYTVAGILAYVNERSSEHYDDIKWVESFYCDNDLGGHFVPQDMIEEWAITERLEHWNDGDGIRVKTYTGVWKYIMHRVHELQGKSGPYERVEIILEEAT